MKKNIFYISIVVFAFALHLTSCKKRYPDNPTIYVNLKSFHNRLSGTWQVEHFLVNNTDEIQFYNDSCACTFRFGALKNQPNYQNNGWYWWLENCKYLDLQTPLMPNAPKNNRIAGYFSYKFDIGQPGLYNHVIMPFRNSRLVYNIRRLTKKELWLETTFDGIDYLIKSTKK